MDFTNLNISQGIEIIYYPVLNYSHRLPTEHNYSPHILGPSFSATTTTPPLLPLSFLCTVGFSSGADLVVKAVKEEPDI